MLKEIFATCLLLHGCSSRGLTVVYPYSHDSNDNNIVEKLDNPYYAYGSSTLGGGYNFVDYFDLDDDNPIHVDCYFNDYDSDFFNTLLYCNGSVYYLYQLSIIQYYSQVSVSLYCFEYDDLSTYVDFTIPFDNGDVLSDLEVEYRDLYFYVTNPYVLDSDSYQQFNKIFTSNDNQYVVSYNGYYSFLSGGITPLSTNPTILGNIVLNNVIYYGIRTGSFYFSAISIDYVNNTNTVVNGLSYSQSPNIWFNNVKLTKSDYTYLNTIGVFGYSRPTTYDDSTFNDLLFSIMDSPIYMLSRLLNFELFGVNVFIAVTGLLTLALVVVVIRKIW